MATAIAQSLLAKRREAAISAQQHRGNACSPARRGTILLSDTIQPNSQRRRRHGRGAPRDLTTLFARSRRRPNPATQLKHAATPPAALTQLWTRRRAIHIATTDASRCQYTGAGRRLFVIRHSHVVDARPTDRLAAVVNLSHGCTVFVDVELTDKHLGRRAPTRIAAA